MEAVLRNVKKESSIILSTEIPEGEEVRCPYWNDKLEKTCGKLLYRGRPSPEPQEFWCDRCKRTVIIQRIG